MKKIITLALVLAMATTMLTSCGTENGSDEGTSSATTSSATSSATSTDDTSKEETAELDIREDIYAAIAGAYTEESLFATGEIPAEMLEGEFPIDTALYSDAAVYMPMISTFADRIAIFKAADGKAADLVAALEGVKEAKIADTMQYPQNIAKIQSTQVVANGDYVAFLMCGAMNEDMDASEEDALTFAQAEVQKAVDAFNGLFA